MIDIEDNVPLPDDGWTSKPSNVVKYEGRETIPVDSFNPPQPGPNDCTFVGGPLNGQFGPLKDNAPKVVEIEIYAADGSVAFMDIGAFRNESVSLHRRKLC